MRHGRPYLGNKMKFLTGPYLALMNAFVDRSKDVLRDKTEFYNRISLMQEYCTLRLDGGRQSGKTEALGMFARDWIEDGGEIIVLTDTIGFAEITRSRILSKFDHSITGINPKDKIYMQSIRKFLSSTCRDRFRGHSLSKVLVIIDEPCHRMPEIYKFYKAYEEYISICTATSGLQLPLFFVLGVQ